MYRCEATSIRGFVQQLAVGYVSQGYWFYVCGWVKEPKDPKLLDEKLVARYDIGISKWARARRKQAGLGNVQYLRYGRFFVLLATHGSHPMKDAEGEVRDIRRQPLSFSGYSISYRRGVDRKWHASVRIHPKRYRELKSYLLDLAKHRSAENLADEFRRLPFEPYAPVRRQLLHLLRAVNRARREAGFTPIPVAALRLRRSPVKVFCEGETGVGNEMPVADLGVSAAHIAPSGDVMLSRTQDRHV